MRECTCAKKKALVYTRDTCGRCWKRKGEVVIDVTTVE